MLFPVPVADIGFVFELQCRRLTGGAEAVRLVAKAFWLMAREASPKRRSGVEWNHLFNLYSYGSFEF